MTPFFSFRAVTSKWTQITAHAMDFYNLHDAVNIHVNYVSC